MAGGGKEDKGSISAMDSVTVHGLGGSPTARVKRHPQAAVVPRMVLMRACECVHMRVCK